jgi:protein-serine/threonine kinase
VNASPPKAEHLTDEYVLHPSVYAFKEAHPKRPMVAFGPYVLLQTLGEGEFGKVKLGVHADFGVEVAIKLIRRGSLEDEVSANKVEREIDVLKVS